MKNIRKRAINNSLKNEAYKHKKRITSLHNVLLPPKKKKSADNCKFITFRFILLGTIPSKKNMIWADSNFNTLKKSLHRFKAVYEAVDWLQDKLKVYVRNSQKYKEWMATNHEIIMQQAAIEMQRYQSFGLIYPLSNCTLKIYHYFRDNIERDLSNKLATIEDLLVECNIIAGDQWQHLNKIESEGELYYKEITEAITEVSITVRVPSKPLIIENNQSEIINDYSV